MSPRGYSIRDGDRPATQTGMASPHASGQWDINAKRTWAVKLPMEAQGKEADRWVLHASKPPGPAGSSL